MPHRVTNSFSGLVWQFPVSIQRQFEGEFMPLTKDDFEDVVVRLKKAYLVVPRDTLGRTLKFLGLVTAAGVLAVLGAVWVTAQKAVSSTQYGALAREVESL